MASQESDTALATFEESEQGGIAAASETHETAPPKYKTISCTECRRRKLKCDRRRPSCGTCSRLQEPCVYPEGRIKSATKRRNVKDLEARLAQVESLLSEGASSYSNLKLPIGSGRPESYSALGSEIYWTDLNLDVTMTNDSSGTADILSSGPSILPSLTDPYMSNELIGSGLQENLPSQDIQDELHKIYFARVHPTVPTIPKYRYLANVKLPPPLGPPICLRYAVWALAASVSEKYSNLQDVFYHRAKRYAEADEMKGYGQSFITLSHAQCWAMISGYEAQTMHFSRAWLSGGKGIRLVQMMNLHHLDGDRGDNVKQILGPPKDWMDLEERRRTFWNAFCCDRYACAGTGWPMTIDESDITTLLPASEEAYELGHEEVTTTLSDATTAEGAARVSPYAGVVLMACLFGHNWLHLHRPTKNDRPDDYMNGEFWKRHRKMDAVLINTSTFLPERLGLPAGLHDPNIVALHMNIQASTICLHQAAVLTAEKHDLDPGIAKQCQTRCRFAASEIVKIMRLISNTEVTEMNTWVSFNLYVATGVLIEGCYSPETSQESRSNLDFLLAALEKIGRQHVVTQAFVAQLKIDLETASISSLFDEVNVIDTRFRPWGARAVDFRNSKGRIVEYLCDTLSQSKPSTVSLFADQESPEGYSTSGNDSGPSLQDLCNKTSDLSGILPKQDMADRIRRASGNLSFGGSNQNEQNTGANFPEFFKPHTMSAKRPIPVDRGVGNISDFSSDRQASLSATFPQQQQFMQLGNDETQVIQDMNEFYLNNSKSGVPLNLPFSSIDDTGTGEFPDLDFSSFDGQNLDYILNGTAWDGSTFQA